MGIRLNKVLSELNIGIHTAVEFLKGNHIGEIRDDAIPNNKITDDQYLALKEKFGRTKSSNIFGRIRRRNSPRYNKPHYETADFYVKQLKEYFEKNYSNERIYMSDIDLAINKFNLRGNSECFKIKLQLQWYVDEHNNSMYVSALKKNIEQEKKNIPLEEKVFTWENITFCDGKIEIRDEDYILVATYELRDSRRAFNDIKAHFKIKFSDLEIQIKRGKVMFNDAKRFKELVSSLSIPAKSTFIPDLEITPKKEVMKYFDGASNQEIKNYIIQLRQQYLTYLCTKHLDGFKIKYTTEWRSTCDYDYLENAFLFTISASKSYIIIIYENTEDSRSSIAFYVNPTEYDKAINGICGYFSSMEINKRETLASYYVNFKDSGILRFHRIYHTDFNQWKRTINSFQH